MQGLRLEMSVLVLVSLATVSGPPAQVRASNPESLVFDARTRSKTESGDFRAEVRRIEWNPQKTTVVICDMWDQHWCKGATRRVADMAPRMNAVVAALRKRGALIIHCPSGTLGHYARGDSPAARALALAKAAPKVATQTPLSNWCKLDAKRESKLPIDDSDGGCDCVPGCRSRSAWNAQIATIDIVDGDAMSDSATAFYLMKQRGIENVIVMGVHTNMCVLGRPFSIRQMVYQGQNVVLMRDLTDTMYNSRQAPYVDHHSGTDLVVEHIERHWCPTVTSDQILGGRPHRFADDHRKRVTVVMAEREYDTARTLPALARRRWIKDFRVRYVHADPENPNRLPGLVDALSDTDVLVLSVRRRAPTSETMRAVRRYLADGGAVVGVRTTSHAFDTKGVVPDGHADWPTFDKDVLGCHYQGHHGNKSSGAPPTYVRTATGRTATGRIAAGRDTAAGAHRIVRGIPEGEIRVTSWLYKHDPLVEGAEVLMLGRVGERKPHEPVTWSRVRKDGGRVFYTSLGHPDDFASPWFAQMLTRGLHWAAGSDVPVPVAKPPAEKARREKRETSWATGARSPRASLATMRTPSDLAVDLVVAEPDVVQPVFLNFDERGRMWVVQYRQYPHPAGLRIMSRDHVWRNVYDRYPPPPPHAADSPFRGADRITIHTDTDGDGSFDQTKVFLDGLNMCTSVARGRGGVWVLNPPYLLFYADRDGDDVPDGDGRPTVHLRGFWLEDSHSIANSLRWGPDGWLYGAQGSTVSADVVVVAAGGDRPPVHTQGQQIWRYHPERKVFEVFAEGGGNAFGCEIDAKGRVFSGHNGGNTRGYHYPQGGYLRKGFHKHGALSNPYAFGHFPHMPHPDVARFTHNFVVYEGHTLPEKYRGRLFGVDPINRYVPVTERIPDGATFKTRDVDAAIRTSDDWFRPVDIKHGPDGAIYVCDWYDANVNHYRNHEGRIDKRNGRIYRIRSRIRSRVRRAQETFDLASWPTADVIELLGHPNRWHREQARRILGDRRDASTIPALTALVLGSTDQLALEALWALHLTGGFDDAVAVKCLRHRDPHVRGWTARLLGDAAPVSSVAGLALRTLAATERHPEVRSQLASTAKRLAVADCLSVFAALTSQDLDSADRYIPLLLWWALESKCGTHGDEVVALFASAAIWQRPVIQKHIAGRLMRRFASTGTRRDLVRCARLLTGAPDAESRGRLMDGFERAYRGRTMAGLPSELVAAIAKAGGGTLAMRVRRRDPAALAEALRLSEDAEEPSDRRAAYLDLFAELEFESAVPVLLRILSDERSTALRSAALAALQTFENDNIGREVVAIYPQLGGQDTEAARSLLASRARWTAELVAAIDRGTIDKRTIPAENVARMRLHPVPAIAAAIDRIFGKHRKPTPAHLSREISRIKAVIGGGRGDPYKGKPIFLSRCASCHRLFADGKNVGPDLTAQKRDDLDSMLLAIVDPDAEIREGFERFVVTTKDDRIVVGFKADEDRAVFVLRGADGQSVRLARDQIASIDPAPGSLMPGSLIADLKDAQLRDLFAYLRTTQPQVK